MRHPRSNRDIRDSLEVNKTEANYVGFCLIFWSEINYIRNDGCGRERLTSVTEGAKLCSNSQVKKP